MSEYKDEFYLHKQGDKFKLILISDDKKPSFDSVVIQIEKLKQKIKKPKKYSSEEIKEFNLKRLLMELTIMLKSLQQKNKSSK